VVGVSSWPLSTVLIFDLGIVPRVWWVFVFVFVYHRDIRMTRVVLSVMLIFQIDEAVPIFSFFSFVFFCDIASTS
jgi:hypothetical protein